MDKELHQRVLSAVNPDRMIRLLQRMIRFPSFSETPGESDLARWLAEELAGRGLEAHLQEVSPGRFNTLAWHRGTGGGPSLMLNGHIDTNMVGLGWTKDPFAGVVEDGFVFGIGVSNMKAADAAMIEAVQAVRDAGIDLAGDVCLAMVVGELQGGVGTLQMLRQGVRTDYFIVGELSDLAIRTMTAGAFECFIHVLGRTRHIARMEEGINAIEKMYDVIRALKGLRFSGAERPDYAGLQRMNVGVIRGGVGRDYQDWRAPLVPDFCTIKLACRIAPSQTPESAIADIVALLRDLQRRDPDLQFEVERVPDEVVRYMPAFEVDPNHPFVRCLAAAHQEVTGRDPLDGNVAPYKYGANDATHLASYGMTGVIYGPGGRYNTQEDERIAVEIAVAAARVYALMIVDTCGPRLRP